jgi:serine/threonine-protein kinase
MTLTGTVLGTSNYIAPEQARGQHVDAQTDVYSLGVVLYELLTGHVPFPGDNFVAVAMRHINDPAPNVVDERPDVPPRLAAAIARALEKDPRDRIPSMGAFAVELDACLHELDHPETESTLIVPPPVRREPTRPAEQRSHRSRWPLILAIAGLLAAAAVVIGILTLGGSNGNQPNQPSGGGGGSIAVTLHGVKGYDPQGTGGEHDGDAAKAVDGDSATYWQTEHYASQSFGGLKNAVGLLLGTGKPVSLKQLTVTTDTPGFQARILAGDSADGPFSTDSKTTSVESTTTFALNGREAGYYVVWITSLPSGGSAHVNEVRAR